MQHYEENQKLKQQIHSMHQYIQHVNHYLNHLKIYEYYIQGIKIEKVKGNFQIGQLLQKEMNESEGIHRFFIGEITIREIEDAGTVGLGVVEKGISSKGNESEYSDEVKKIMEEIKSLLDIGELPAFFQELAGKENVLKKVWESLKEKFDSTEGFNFFYEEVLKGLNNVTSLIEKTDTNLEDETYIALADSIEEKAKSLLCVAYIIEAYLPGMIKRYQQDHVKVDSEQIQKLKQHGVKSHHIIIQAIKKTFYLEELPPKYHELVDKPAVLRHVTFSILQPALSHQLVEAYFKKMKTLFVTATEEMIEHTQLRELPIDEQTFLFSVVIKHIDCIPKHILLDYLLLQI
ncbi:hypothetical protein IM538_04505 [Cytobacillus suaedae]|nr:hypothetical protein IM538_04505 [Cytobacillus suaedae]